MTPTPEPPDRDPMLADAWRAYSRESPPEALDRRILAAAHRAAGSGPRSAAKATGATAATRPQRWWMPLAAAATIGVIAVGVLQSLPDDHDLLSVTEPAAPESADVREQAVAPTGQKDAASAVSGRDAAPAAEVASAMKKPRAEVQSAEKTGSGNETAMAQESKRSAEGVAQQRRPQAPQPASVPKLPSLPPPPPLERESAVGSGKLDAARTQAPVPFPAAAAPRSAPSASQESDARMSARNDASVERQQHAAAPKLESRERRDDSRAGAGDAVTSLTQKSALADELRAKARDPDAWIARIRKLRDEGDTAQALREVRDFRSVVPDAERRLPGDLREWADARQQ
ncbi:MAG: anti-sigma factor [Burkholderiales bacterium]|nr:anti-sigma factor [Burkholderiales bacterium]